jgi:carboxyl-terminal processing protease
MKLLKSVSLMVFIFFVGPASAMAAAETKVPFNAPTLPIKDVQRFTGAISAVKNYYVEPVTDNKLFENAIRGMLTGLDPHSSYLDEQDLRDLQDITTGEFGGLGIEVMMDDGFIQVISPLDDTPADKAGIKPGDMIVRINKEPVKGMSLRDAVTKMRGKKGTDIKLTIIRKGENVPLTFDLKREIILVKSVKSQLLDDAYGYIRVSNFQSTTGNDLTRQVTDLKEKAKGRLKGVVLDLRNNPGGLLDSAVDVTNTFLDSAKLGFNRLIVYTKGRLPDAQYQAHANSKDLLQGAPLVVLINEGSASGSEIVAGALQDYKRAVVMGTKSFGKGSVQTILPLDDNSAIKLTTALYYTPAGRSIQAKGIVPDVIVEELKLPKENKEKKLLDAFDEADLQHHLHNGNGKKAEPADEATPLEMSEPEEETKAPRKSSRELASPTTDFQLREALNLLKGLATVGGG